MRSPLLLLAVLVISCLSGTLAKSVTGNRILVLLDNLAEKENYSRFWRSLEDREYQLTFVTEGDDQPTILQRYGEYQHDHVIHFASNSKDIGKHKSFGNVQLVDFVNKGGNLLVATSSDPSNAVRDLAAEFDIDFDAPVEEDSLVEIVSPKSIVDLASVDAPVFYGRGVTLAVGKNPMLNRVLRSASEDDLVASMQARNSARATFVGSKDVFSDSFMETTFEETRPNGTAKRRREGGNEAFVREVTKWTFQEKSVLKIVNHRHHKVNETAQPNSYRIKDDIVYILEVSEYADDKWVPFHADDIQLEVIMLDPYIRTTLKQADVVPEHHYGRFTAHLRLPDVYGVFTLKVNYKRPGLTYLLAEDVVAIRPFRHNEYPRFLSAAYPYYAAVGSMIVGFLVFSAVWLSTWGGEMMKKPKPKAQ